MEDARLVFSRLGAAHSLISIETGLGGRQVSSAAVGDSLAIDQRVVGGLNCCVNGGFYFGVNSPDWTNWG